MEITTSRITSVQFNLKNISKYDTVMYSVMISASTGEIKQNRRIGVFYKCKLIGSPKENCTVLVIKF